MNLTHKKALLLAVAAALGMVTPFAQATIITSLTDNTDTSAVKFALEEQGEATKDYYGRTSVSSTLTQGSIVDQDLTIHIPIIAGYTVTQANRMVVRLTLTGGAKFANKPYLVCANTSIAVDGAGVAVAPTTTKWSDGTLGRSGAAGANAPCLMNAAGGNLASLSTVADVCSTAASIYDAGGGTTTGVSAFYMSPDTGGKNNVTATFTLPEKLVTRVGVPGGSGAGCILTFGQGDDFTKLASAGLGGVPGASAFVTAFTLGSRQDIGLKAEVTYVDAGVNTTKPYQGTIIKFVTALGATIKAGAPHTIDVGKKASKEFTEGLIVSLGTFNLSAGQTQPVPALAHPVPRVSKSYVDYFAASTTNVANVVASGFAVTISGPTVGGAKQAWLDTLVTCNGTKKGTTQIVATSGGTSVTLTVTGIGDATDVVTNTVNYLAANALSVCLEVPGTTLLSDGQLSATLTGFPKSTSFMVDLGAGGNLSKIDRNGAVVRVLNVPAVGNADQVFLRFYNTSSQPAQVRATLYGQDGKMIGTENAELFSALKANDVEILDAAKLQTKLGITAPWSGRAWLLIQADADKDVFKVQALIRAPGTPGVLVNLSGEAYN